MAPINISSSERSTEYESSDSMFAKKIIRKGKRRKKTNLERKAADRQAKRPNDNTSAKPDQKSTAGHVPPTKRRRKENSTATQLEKNLHDAKRGPKFTSTPKRQRDESPSKRRRLGNHIDASTPDVILLDGPGEISDIRTRWNITDEIVLEMKMTDRLVDSIVNASMEGIVRAAQNSSIAFVPVIQLSAPETLDEELARFETNEMVLIPVGDRLSTVGTRYFLILYYKSKCYYFDSLTRTDPNQLERIQNFCETIVNCMDPNRLTSEEMTTVQCVSQLNEEDSGIHTIRNARMLVQTYASQHGLTVDFHTDWQSRITEANVTPDFEELCRQFATTTDKLPNMNRENCEPETCTINRKKKPPDRTDVAEERVAGNETTPSLDTKPGKVGLPSDDLRNRTNQKGKDQSTDVIDLTVDDSRCPVTGIQTNKDGLKRKHCGATKSKKVVTRYDSDDDFEELKAVKKKADTKKPPIHTISRSTLTNAIDIAQHGLKRKHCGATKSKKVVTRYDSDDDFEEPKAVTKSIGGTTKSKKSVGPKNPPPVVSLRHEDGGLEGVPVTSKSSHSATNTSGRSVDEAPTNRDISCKDVLKRKHRDTTKSKKVVTRYDSDDDFEELKAVKKKADTKKPPIHTISRSTLTNAIDIAQHGLKQKHRDQPPVVSWSNRYDNSTDYDSTDDEVAKERHLVATKNALAEAGRRAEERSKRGKSHAEADTTKPSTSGQVTCNRSKTAKSSSKWTTAQSTDNGYHATIRTSEEDVKFLHHKLRKEVKRYICPFGKTCGKKDFSSFVNLQQHCQRQHNLNKKELLRPVESAPINWRREQNSNRRFAINSIKLKLCSLLVGGRSVVSDNRARLVAAENGGKQQAWEPADQRNQNKMAREVFDILEQQAVELSKLAILFSHLVYWKIYRFIETADDTRIDQVFAKNIDWNLILLKFKSFKRATKNSNLSNENKISPKLTNVFEYTDDSEFFAMCERHGVRTNFDEWSQNSWRYISETFGANFRTNINTHLYTRLRNWLYFKLRNGKKMKDVRGKENRKKTADKVYHTMKFMFDSEKCTQPTMVQHDFIKELQSICKFPEFNKAGSSYFRRLFYDYKEDDDDDDSANKVSKPKRAKKSTQTKSKPKKAKRQKTQNNGPRLLWLQMVPGMLRLQKWIYATNLARRNQQPKAKKYRRRKRNRKSRHESAPTTLPNTSAEQPARHRRKKKSNKRQRKAADVQDDEAIFTAKLRNFIVVPQHNFSRKHFAIDSKSLFDVVKTLTAFRPHGTGLYAQNEFVDLNVNSDNANRKTANPFWYFIFNLKKLETETKKFGGRITTNGSDVSVQFCKVKHDHQMTKAEVVELANQRKRKSTNVVSSDDSESEEESISASERIDPKIVKQLKLTDLNDLSVCGVDLGIRNIAATVRHTWHSSETHESNVLHKSKDYHYKAGFHKRRREQRRMVGAFDEKYKHDRTKDGEEPSLKSPDYLKYLNSRLKWFNEGTTVYLQRRVCNLKFDKFRSTQRELTKMAQEIVGEIDVHNPTSHRRANNKKLRVVFIGDCSTPANSTIKGHLRSPGDKPLCRYIKQRPNTVVIRQDEFRTTKNCSRCFKELANVESSKERLKICKICTPPDDSMPAPTQISTFRNKTQIAQRMAIVQIHNPKPTQFERASRVAMNRLHRYINSDRLRMRHRERLKSRVFENTGGSETKLQMLWNRDINAGRNISYLGLCKYGTLLNPYFNQPLRKNTAFFRHSCRK